MDYSKVERPIMGVGVLVLSNDDRILFGKRKPGGMYGNPGGKLDLFEEFVECAQRELYEEAGIKIDLKDFKFVKTINSYDKSEKIHFVSAFLTCKNPSDQTIRNCEPDKCEGWEWWSFDDMEVRKAELFLPIRELYELHKAEFNLDSLKKLLNS